jgi:hypothetical protein
VAMGAHRLTRATTCCPTPSPASLLGFAAGLLLNRDHRVCQLEQLAELVQMY